MRCKFTTHLSCAVQAADCGLPTQAAESLQDGEGHPGQLKSIHLVGMKLSLPCRELACQQLLIQAHKSPAALLQVHFMNHANLLVDFV